MTKRRRQKPEVTSQNAVGTLVPSRLSCIRTWLAALCLLLSAFCLSSVQAQFSQTQGNSPLYSSRPYEARAPSGLPKALTDVGIDQKLNEQLPLDAVFRNENGEAVKLGDYFGKKPVLLSLVYYDCPMLCNQVLNEWLQTSECWLFSRAGV
jgi:protein SCO1/2